jgi:hypothetical protein
VAVTPEPLYTADGWTITRQPNGTTNPFLVRFSRSTSQRKLLDQVAEWHWIAGRWCHHRWTPRPPTVPEKVLVQVEARMLEVAQEMQATP